MSFGEWILAVKQELASMPGNTRLFSPDLPRNYYKWYEKWETPEDMALRIWETQNTFVIHIG